MAALTYPTNQLLAVFDDPTQAAAAAKDLTAARFSVSVLRGEEGADRFRGEGAGGHWTRVVRLFQFLSMDQGPDFHYYASALRTGRAVVAVHVRGRDRIGQARDILTGHGGHFLNYFGRLQTEELTQWRGPEPPLPEHFRR